MKKIILYILSVIIMISFVPVISNDYIIALIYTVFIISILVKNHSKTDIIFLAFGFIAMTFFEYIFVSTGVETFQRNTLFGVMPFWLPFLWGYSFIVMKQIVEILDVRN